MTSRKSAPYTELLFVLQGELKAGFADRALFTDPYGKKAFSSADFGIPVCIGLANIGARPAQSLGHPRHIDIGHRSRIPGEPVESRSSYVRSAY